ncbi:ankyrin repeats (3 copies) domain-containing protein [Sarocladium implicatum]|nr:ankyrin repeats (3 copies) domain-containing protein [Sarocladium implicatum]
MGLGDLPTELLEDIGWQLCDHPRSSITIFCLSLVSRRFHRIFLQRAYDALVREERAAGYMQTYRIALLKAAKEGFETPLFGLIEAGAAADGYSVHQYRWDAHPLWRTDSALIDATYYDHPDLAIKLIERYNARPYYRLAGGNNTMEYAILRNHVSLVNFILNTDRETVQATLLDDESKNNTVKSQHTIVDLDRAAILELILEANKNLKLGPEFVEKYHDRMLLSSARLGRISIVGTLLNKTNIDPNKVCDGGKQNALHIAIANGHRAVAKLLLASGRMDPGICGRDGQTPFFTAVKKGDASTVRDLLDTGKVDCFLLDSFHRTALHYAVRRRHVEIIKLILLEAAGLEVFSRCQGLSLVPRVTNIGTGPLGLSLDFKGPVNLQDHLDRARLAVSAALSLISALSLDKMLDRDPRPVAVTVERQRGVRHHLMEMLEVLLEPTTSDQGIESSVAGLRIEAERESTQTRPRSGATDFDPQWSILQHHPAIKKKDTLHDGQEKPLYNVDDDAEQAAAVRRMILTVARLCLGGDASQHTVNPPHHRHVIPSLGADSRLFSWCLEHHNVGLAFLLLESGRCAEDPTSSLDKLLLLAVKREDAVVVKELVRRGAKPSVVDSHDGTALMIAAARGNLGLVKTLVEPGVALDARPSGRTQQKTALFLACERNHEDVARYLIESGANVDIPDMDSTTPLMVATAPDKDLGIARLLLGRANQWMKNSNGSGRTALLEAIANRHRDSIKLLLNPDGSALEVEDNEGERPLIWALRNREEWIAEMLIRAGADANAADGSGCTALEYSAHFGKLDLLELMLEYGATLGGTESGQKLTEFMWQQGGRWKEIYMKWCL